MNTITINVSVESLKEFLRIPKSKTHGYHKTIYIDDGMIAATDGRRIYAYEHESLRGFQPTRLVADEVKIGKHDTIVIENHISGVLTAHFCGERNEELKFISKEPSGVLIKKKLVQMKTVSNEGNRVTCAGFDTNLVPKKGRYVLKQDHSGMYFAMQEITYLQKVTPMKTVILAVTLTKEEKNTQKACWPNSRNHNKKSPRRWRRANKVSKSK